MVDILLDTRYDSDIYSLHWKHLYPPTVSQFKSLALLWRKHLWCFLGTNQSHYQVNTHKHLLRGLTVENLWCAPRENLERDGPGV